MPASEHAACVLCSGTGRMALSVPGGRTEAGLLRAELCRVWGIVKSLEMTATEALEAYGRAQVMLSADVERALARIRIQDGEIKDLKKEVAVKRSWNGKPSESGDAIKSRREFRAEERAGEAEERGEDPPPRKGIGKQPGTAGVSRDDRPAGTLRFAAGLCRWCGRADLLPHKTVRKRVYEIPELGAGITCLMYVIRHMLCQGCGAVTVPHTGAIGGTAMCPNIRAAVSEYHLGNPSQHWIRHHLAVLQQAGFSAGAISNCLSAMARHIDGGTVRVADEEPIIIDDGSLRTYRSPLEPPPGDDQTEYGIQDAAPAMHGNTWTASAAQPVMVRILERASMDPFAQTDETGNAVAGRHAQTLVSNTLRTTLIRTVRHKNGETLRRCHAWMIRRPAVRDGVGGFGWCRELLQRCLIHILRKSEHYAMKWGLDSDEHLRHKMLKALYCDIKEAAKEIVRRAGGPVRCASGLDIVSRVPGLFAFVEDQIAQFSGRLRMIIESFPADGVATTLNNAFSDFVNALRYPGMPLHNNDTELIIRRYVIAGRRSKGPFPNWRAAYNFSILQSFAATCEKNGVTSYRATLEMARDPSWDIFASGVPPPILAGGAAAGSRETSAVPA